MKKDFLSVLLLGIIFTGCTERVPPGYVGMIMEPGGLSEKTLQPGNHGCWGRDRLVLFETKEATVTESLSVLCSDDLNFKFDLKVRARLRISDGAGMKGVLEKQGANIIWRGSTGVLGFNVLYATYVKPAARSLARTVVSKYQTTQIRENRESIQKSIQTKLTAAVQGTPMEIGMVATSNFDYPEVEGGRVCLDQNYVFLKCTHPFFLEPVFFL